MANAHIMIEYVYRPSRRVGRKRLLARLYSGRYSLTKGQKPVTVALHTPDAKVAAKRLRDIIVNEQKEQEGMISPRAQREAQSLPLLVVVAEYKADLVGRQLAPGHVKETVGRIERMINSAAWKKLSDIRPDSFIRFRSSLTCSAKTKKEYQTSVSAFLNWCVRTDRLLANPLVKVDRVDIRGKSVRPTRAFTSQELLRLFSTTKHALFYQTLLYTGQRRTEVASLVWSDLDTLSNYPSALFRDGTMKDKEKRAVPLHVHLAAALNRSRPAGALVDDLVFPNAPTYETLRCDLTRASIEHKDSLGRVVHFHAFRKTFQTMGVRAGINQRSAQALLGHSDPALTANAYTDVAALELHAEVAKLTWLTTETDSQLRTQKVSAVVRKRRISEIVAELIDAAKSSAPSEDREEFQTVELAARHGFEP